jgi:2-oxoglutaroyl-CoA hydrolase
MGGFASEETMTTLAFQAPGLPTRFDGFHVEFSPKNSSAEIVLDRSPFNLMSLKQCEQIRHVFETLDADAAVRVIVLRGAGEHFSSGNFKHESIGVSTDHESRLAWALSSPSRCSKPVIAATRGYCFGAAFELSLACDLRLATETTLYGLPEQNAGRVVGFESVACLRGLIGTGRTRDIVMRSRLICGVQAYDWGIATEFAMDSELEDATNALVAELLELPSDRQRAAKKLLNSAEAARFSLEFALEHHG